MMEEPGAAMRLLYQIKVGLERYHSNKDKTVTGLKKEILDKKVKKVEELSSTLPMIHKKMGVDGPTFKASHIQQIEKKLLKYELAKVTLEKKAHEDDLKEKNMLMSM